MTNLVEELLGAAKKYQNHRIALVLEIAARYEAAKEIIPLPITDENIACHTEELEALSANVLHDEYTLMEIRLRVPTYIANHIQERPTHEQLAQFKYTSAAAALLCTKTILDTLKPIHQKPDMNDAITRDHQSRLMMESERFYRNMISAISSAEELNSLERIEERSQSDQNKGRKTSSNYDAFKKDLTEAGRYWWNIDPLISSADIARHFLSKVPEDKYRSLLKQEASAHHLKNTDFAPEETKEGGRPNKINTINYILENNPPSDNSPYF